MISRTSNVSDLRDFLSVVGLLLAMCECAFAANIVQSATNPANLHKYYLLGGIKPVDAEVFALTLGGHLATINDAAEDVWVRTTFNEVFLWIGLNDIVQEGQFVWYSGEPVTYTNWWPSAPYNIRGSEDWVTIYNYSDANYQWLDNSNIDSLFGFQMYAVVEVVPEPSSFVLVALAVVGLASWGIYRCRC